MDTDIFSCQLMKVENPHEFLTDEWYAWNRCHHVYAVSASAVPEWCPLTPINPVEYEPAFCVAEQCGMCDEYGTTCRGAERAVLIEEV